MAQRTIKQAEAEGSAMAPFLNTWAEQQITQSIEARKAEAREFAAGARQRNVDRSNRVGEECFERMNALITRYDEFIDVARNARVAFVDALDALDQLDDERQAASRLQYDFESAVAVIEEIDADPVAYVDSRFYEPYPSLRPEFGF